MTKALLTLVLVVLASTADAGPRVTVHKHYGARNSSDAVVGGFLGGLAGSVFGSWLNQPQSEDHSPPPPSPPPPAEVELKQWSPEWYSYCFNKYKSFNPQTGTYTGYDGVTYPCR